MYPAIDKVVREYFNMPDLPYVGDLQRHVSILLVNAHYSLEKYEPLPVNIIPVGGLHIRDPQPFDEELQNFIANAKKGIVLFSLGSIVKSSALKDDVKAMFIEAFKVFPDYHFIWKYEGTLKVPPNVMISKWVNQNDILANPKTKGFISHGGLLGVQEAAWWGVPLIGIPVFMDQFKVKY